MTEFTTSTLPIAVRTLLETNQYDVEGPVKIHGAEIDLVAQRRGDPFAPRIYIEVTIEYVNTEKYGKDLTKFALVREKEPDCQCLIVSSRGFSLPVSERAEQTRIRTKTYDALFREFEQFDRYVSRFIGPSEQASDLARLAEIYEEPEFHDRVGQDFATRYLTAWRNALEPRAGWIVITGEYGTGKTALTKVLQYRWLQDYKQNPSLPLPLRIELRDFSRQFDVNSLLHYFLDKNDLSHVPIEFVRTLIRTGRAVLLLDGYDEMAQYLHARERRACLEALAELSDGGARGILTSRPNYFTETEELQVFEILYRSLNVGAYRLTTEASSVLERELRIDNLLKQFIDRFERTLKDLSEDQTVALVNRVLASDPVGREAVFGVLKRIFRSVTEGDAVSLSGKPVIVTYLVDLVEGLKSGDIYPHTGGVTLSEWQVYKLIVDQLMLRDLSRSPRITPTQRRVFLQKLAIILSIRDHPAATESDMKELISREFRRELQGLPPESRASQVEEYFADVRSSTTLTSDRAGGWRFSHNSLREYLVAEYLISQVEAGEIANVDVPISDAMRIFVASRTAEEKSRLLESLARSWKSSGASEGKGRLLCLLWDGLVSLFRREENSRRVCLENIVGNPIAITNTSISGITLSTESDPTPLEDISFAGTVLSRVNLAGADLSNADFSHAMLEDVILRGAKLEGTHFVNALLENVDLSEAKLGGAHFEQVKPDDISILLDTGETRGQKRVLRGLEALGYLRFHGSYTKDVPVIYVVSNHPRFPIVEKIIEKLTAQSLHQRRGLAQRGAAHLDPKFAHKFVAYLESCGFLWSQKNRKGLVEVTVAGRQAFAQFTLARELPVEIVRFLEGSLE